MPVPVPLVSKPAAHPVIKKTRNQYGTSHSFVSSTHTVPPAPSEPPPAFRTHDEWVASLPSWRREKTRGNLEEECHPKRSLQGFHQGLAEAANVPAIKGVHAEACNPPFLSSAPPTLNSLARTVSLPVYTKEGVANVQSQVDQCPIVAPVRDSAQFAQPSRMSGHCSFGAFSPVQVEHSPTSPNLLREVTPFGDFIDRALDVDCPPRAMQPPIPSQVAYGQVQQVPYQVISAPQEPVPAPAIPSEALAPSATAAYKKLAEPLSDWVASYIWKSCTANFGFTESRSTHTSGRPYPFNPPAHLSTSVHSLLLSTLLQPSAVFLALWYISRLPIVFGPTYHMAEKQSESQFREILFGKAVSDQERESTENKAPFRLIVLGCMLANKWLDDHTFSNKTWHSISNVHIHVLNAMERFALDIFNHDLSVSFQDWNNWLGSLRDYHISLSAVSRQPISRPSSNPHAIVGRTLDDIINAPSLSNFDPGNPQPIFLNRADWERSRAAKEHAMGDDALEIDLDEDGPLREEYLPKRRVSGAGSVRNNASHVGSLGDKPRDWEKHLPPPAEWSPSRDEPILRETNRISGHYVAVQPPTSNPSYHEMAPAMYQDIGYGYTQWPANGYVSIDHLQPHEYNLRGNFGILTNVMAQGEAYIQSVPSCHSQSHSRTQSLSYDQDISLHNRMRSYSQASFDASRTNTYVARDYHPPQFEGEIQWPNRYLPINSFIPPSIGLSNQPTWLRA